MSKISNHLNSVYDSLGKRQKKTAKQLMTGQVLQANEDGFTDVCTYAEAARIAGISMGALYGYVKSGAVRRVHMPGRAYAVGVNIEDVRKLIVDLGTTADLTTAAKKLGCSYQSAHALVVVGRLAAKKIEGCERIRVTLDSIEDEIKYRGGRTDRELAVATRAANSKAARRPTDEMIEELAAGLRRQLEARREKMRRKNI